MAITLKEWKEGLSDHVAQQVVDTFVRHSQILELMPFDNAVSPSGTGSTLTYGYMQKKLPSTAGFRKLNNEYEASAATLDKKTVELKIFGGSFELDRVLKQSEGKFNNMAFQMEEKIISAINLFHDAMINGDTQTNADGFDGLSKMLLGQATELNAGGAAIDLSTAENLKANADQFYEMLTELINTTGANAILANTKMITKIQTVARVLGYKTQSEEAFGRRVLSIDNVRIIDLKNKVTVSGGTAAKSEPIVGIKTGETDIYAVKFDVNDGFHGVTLTGTSGITSYLPDFSQPGAVKKGEVEMVAATVLKNVAHAGVLRKIKITAG